MICSFLVTPEAHYTDFEDNAFNGRYGFPVDNDWEYMLTVSRSGELKFPGKDFVSFYQDLLETSKKDRWGKVLQMTKNLVVSNVNDILCSSLAGTDNNIKTITSIEDIEPVLRKILGQYSNVLTGRNLLNIGTVVHQLQDMIGPFTDSFVSPWQGLRTGIIRRTECTEDVLEHPDTRILFVFIDV